MPVQTNLLLTLFLDDPVYKGFWNLSKKRSVKINEGECFINVKVADFS